MPHMLCFTQTQPFLLQVVPPLSGSKQLKMRYKPANDGPVGRAGEDPSDPCKGELCYR